MVNEIIFEQNKSLEICTLTMVRRTAAMLDLEPQLFSEGNILPRGWHFFMLAGETKRSALRSDGFPGLGVPIPDLGLPRLLLGGRTVTYTGNIVIGSKVHKSSFIKSITEKKTDSGPMAIVTLQHELRPISESIPAITETQTYILLAEAKVSKDLLKAIYNPIEVALQKQFIPDETLLFQYSSLGFNSHKIHIDRDYTQKVEGLPDLVVNGGLTTLLLTEYLRTDLQLELTGLKVKHTAPLYCNRPLTLTAEKVDIGWKLKVYDETNQMAVDMEANTK